MIVKFTITVTKIAELYLLTTWLMCVCGGGDTWHCLLKLSKSTTEHSCSNKAIPPNPSIPFKELQYLVCIHSNLQGFGAISSNCNKYGNHKITAIFLPKQDNDYVSQHVNLDVGKFTRPHHSWRAIYRHGKTVFFGMCTLTACLILCGKL